MFRRTPLRLGVISDVHADLADLDRALEVLIAHRADRVVCLGDALEKGPQPDAVVDRLHRCLIPVVAGNHDMKALRHLDVDPGSLQPRTIEVVQRWPLIRTETWAGLRVVLAHATPYDTRTAITGLPLPREFKRRARTLDADVVLLGHAHRPVAARWRGLRVFNPGSVRGKAARDSHTVGLLHLPQQVFEIIDLDTGVARRLPLEER